MRGLRHGGRASRVGIALAAALALMLSGCGAGPDDAVLSELGAHRRAPITGSDPVTIAFAGDINFEDHLRPVARDPEGLASLRPYFADADVAVVNLETAVTEGGSPIPGKTFTFRTPPSALTTLANAGIDAVGMANNHAADYRLAGLKDTLAARADSPVTIMGVGADAAEAYAPAVFTVDGVSIAVLNASQLAEETSRYYAASEDSPGIALIQRPDRFAAAVADARTRYDVVVAYLHYGTEKVLCPTDRARQAVEWASAAGADAVVGGHSHRVQAGGWQGSTYVNYGLGNFVWFKNTTLPGRTTGVLTLSIDKDRVRERRKRPADERHTGGAVVTGESWHPLEIGRNGIPGEPYSTTPEAMLAKRARLLTCSGLAAAPDA